MLLTHCLSITSMYISNKNPKKGSISEFFYIIIAQLNCILFTSITVCSLKILNCKLSIVL